ncbi:CHAD domain-containing protein [Nitrobacter sp. TKz-YC02]|uniref:CYTH and CHAD domain-containing protein n=1 Tax=Nitrobacter sp. TKz-YC02 TaxID=3398704 RepID=UPI003CEB805D
MTVVRFVDGTYPSLDQQLIMAGNPTEVELKLWVTPEDIIALRNHPHFIGSLDSPTHEMLDSTYFDSDDLFLRDHGLILRVRHVGDKYLQTIKSTDRGAGLFERSEWEQTIEGDQPDLSRVQDTALGRILIDEARKPLKPIFETRVERTTYHLNGNGADIVMAIDEGQILATGSSRPVSEIELELKHGKAADLFKVARDIVDIVPAHLEFKSKPDRGYELVEKMAVAAETASSPELSAGTSTGRAFTLIGRACLRHLVANVPAMLGRDMTALHQMRVALRRLRAAISLFSVVVGDDRNGAIRTELRWLAQELGPARELDTLLFEVIKPLRKRHANEPGLANIGKMFARKRLKSYRQAHEAVRSARFRTLVLNTVEWVEAGLWSTSEDAAMRTRRDMPIELYAAEQLSRRCKRIKRRGARIDGLNAEQLHRLRIQVKKVRYAIEFFADLYHRKKSAKQHKKIRASLTQLQNCLGKANDIVTHKALFEDIIAGRTRGLTEEKSRHCAFAAGLIIGDQQAQLSNALDRARKAYSRFESAKPFWKLPGPISTAPVAEHPLSAAVAPVPVAN